jgi:hypothetical protein
MKNAQANADDIAGSMFRWIEWDRMVNEWCLRNAGCQDVPCSCGAKFVHPRDMEGAPVALVPLSAAARKDRRKAEKLKAMVSKNGGVPRLRMLEGGAQ